MRAMLLIGLCLGFVNLNCGDSQSKLIGTGRGCVDQNDDGDCDIPETPDNQGGGDVRIVPQNCGETAECDSVFDICLRESGTSRHTCQFGCDVELRGSLGTTCAVPGTDSCQRGGRTDIFCDQALGYCRSLTDEEKANGARRTICDQQVVGGEGEGEGEGGGDVGGPCTGTNGECEPPTPGPTEIKCCWSNVTTAHLGQFSWSTSRPSDPEAWAPGTDRPIGADGCATFSVALSTVAVGFWCDVTTVSRAYARQNQWLTTSAPLRHAYVGGVEQTQAFYFEYGRGWRFGQVGGHDPGCYYGVGTCNAPGR